MEALRKRLGKALLDDSSSKEGHKKQDPETHGRYRVVRAKRSDKNETSEDEEFDVWARGTTEIPFNLHVHKDEKNGVRYIEGIAYNAALRGPRSRVEVSKEVWEDPDEDIFYGDEAIRWTVDELKQLDLRGVPMRVQHLPDEELPPVGDIIMNYMDDNGNLCIVARVPYDNEYGKKMVEFIDSDKCSELSIGYGLKRDPRTGVVQHQGIDEVSFVTEAHFRGCGVRAKHGKSEGRTNGFSAPGVKVSPLVDSQETESSNPSFGASRAGRAWTTYYKVVKNRHVTAGRSAGDTEKEDESVKKRERKEDSGKLDPSLNSEPEKTKKSKTESDSLEGSSAKVSSEKEEDMSAPPAKTNNDAKPGLPEDALAQIAKNKEILDAALKQIAQLESANAQLRQDKEASDKKREQEEKSYAAKYGQMAEEVVGQLKEIVKQQMGADVQLSDEWASTQKSMLLDPSPLGQELQTATVSCARRIKDDAATIASQQARILELEGMLQTAGRMAAIPDMEEKRDAKLGRRAAGEGSGEFMQADVSQGSGARNVPDWCLRYSGANARRLNSYAPPAMAAVPDTRQASLGRAAQPQQPQTQQVPQQQQQQVPPQQQSQYQPIPQGRSYGSNYVGMPEHRHSMAKNPRNQEMWGFMKDRVYKDADFDGAFATHQGQYIANPNDMEGQRY